MTRTTRRSILAAVGLGLATAGCVTDGDGNRPTDTTTTDPATTDETAGTTSEKTTAGDWISQASNEPDPYHAIHLTNETDETRTIRVRVVRSATDETVFEETREVPAGTELVAYNLAQADPEGVEAFKICGELVASDETPTTTSEATTGTDDSDARDCVTVKTNECYADAHVTVRDDDSLQIIYAIC